MSTETESVSVVDVQAVEAARQLEKLRALLLVQRLEYYPAAGELIDALSALVGGPEGEAQVKIFMATLCCAYLRLFLDDTASVVGPVAGMRASVNEAERDALTIAREGCKVLLQWLEDHPV